MLCSFSTHHHTLGASRDVSRGRPLVRVRFDLGSWFDGRPPKTRVFKPLVWSKKNVHGMVLNKAMDS